jgi:O-6-methylguanine DNA methyltransferase
MSPPTLDLDRLLADYFRPTAASPGLARRLVREAARDDAALRALVARLAVEAGPRGVRLVRPGRQPAAETAAARRIVDRAREELEQYLAGQRVFFSVPVDLEAVPEFQRRVLAATGGIPFGEARPYAWVAARIGRPRAVRAVGTALARNPVPLLLPCHRVLRSDGAAGGYIFGARIKQRLLALERRTPVLEGCARTRIVCRVGCAQARRMGPEQRVVFASVADARGVGYRPCRLCRPDAAA